MNQDQEESISIPSPLLESIFSHQDSLYRDFRNYSNSLSSIKTEARRILEQEDRILSCDDSTNMSMDRIIGVDGSCSVKRTMASDFHVAFAVCMGSDLLETETATLVTPPIEQPFAIAQGIMSILEIQAMQKVIAPITLYDGSFVTLYIKTILFLKRIGQSRGGVAEALNNSHLKDNIIQFRKSRGLSEVIEREDIVALAKESTSNSISKYVVSKTSNDDKTIISDKVLMSLILHPGEYVIDTPRYGNLKLLRSDADDGFVLSHNKEILDALEEDLKVAYFRPNSWSGAQRVEFNKALSESSIGDLIKTLSSLFIEPSVSEPYPLFITDRICKSISNPIEAITASIMSRLSREGVGLTNEELQWMFREYRTEI